jgi:AcrR family transcriptional regulator
VKYELKKRAERQQQTRQRIVEAAVELHTELGPAATSIKAVAERAGVQRHTVYSHFPTELDLAMACSGLHFEREPPPDPDLIAAIEDGEERLKAGLEALYAYYGRNEALLTHVFRDLEVHETTRIVAQRRFGPFGARLHQVLADGVRVRGRRRARREAALGVATGFWTWRSLVRDQGLDAAQAADVAAAMVLGT